MLFVKGPAFEAFPEPNIIVDSPECGASDSYMSVVHSQTGENHFSHLQ